MERSCLLLYEALERPSQLAHHGNGIGVNAEALLSIVMLLPLQGAIHTPPFTQGVALLPWAMSSLALQAAYETYE